MKFRDLLPGTVFTFYQFCNSDKLVKLNDREVQYVDTKEIDEIISINYRVYPVLGNSYYECMIFIANARVDYVENVTGVKFSMKVRTQIADKNLMRMLGAY